MSILNLFKCLNTFQNVLCVYRNYSSFSERVKTIVKIRICVVYALVLIYYAWQIIELFKEFANTRNANYFIFTLIYFCLLVFNNIVAITLGYTNSNIYTKFVNDIKAIQKLYANDASYILFVKKQQKKLYRDIVLSIIGISMVAFLYARDFWDDLSDKVILISLLYECILAYRFVAETIVYYELIDVVIGLLKCLNQSISASIQNVSADWDLTESRREMDRICGELENWGEVSSLLVAACNRLQDCFGAQVT
jgi:hypothetical protein